MYLEKLTMVDFMPYAGTQEVDFTCDSEHPVILIKGENNRGKSSLFAALRWCLYGKAIKRSGRIIPDYELLNDNAFEEKRDSFEVRLEFTNNSDTFILTRSCTIKKDAKGQRNSSTSKAYLFLNNNAVPNDDIPRYVNSVLNESISMFFLADMEVLEGYEALVEDDDEASYQVKAAIEGILGTPTLLAIRQSLSDISSDTLKELQSARKVNKDQDQITTDLKIQEDKRNKAKDSYDSAIADLKAQKADLTDLSNKLEKISESQQLIIREKQLLNDISRDQNQIEKSRKELQIAVRESWWAPVSKQVEKKQIQTQAALQLAASRETEMSQLNYRFNSLNKSLESNTCSQCGNVLPNDNIKSTKAEISEIEERIKQLSEPVSPTLEFLLSENQRLGFFALPRKADSISTLEKQIRLLLNEMPGRNQEIKEIGQKLMGINRDEIKQLEEDRQVLNRRIGVLSQIMKTENQKIQDAEKEIAALTRKFSNLNSNFGQSELNMEMAIASDLATVMEETIKAFREAMKKRVESNANEIFQNLRSENVVKNLVINENYGLRQIDSKGNIFDHKGAGVAQVIAISLILALARSAALPSALVLDTPFARLDETHRDNILNFIPTESKQVILLIQSGEKISSKVQEKFMQKVSKEYLISMGSNEHESFIRRT
jgi:DNA sulfur modification protein DndD